MDCLTQRALCSYLPLFNTIFDCSHFASSFYRIQLRLLPVTVGGDTSFYRMLLPAFSLRTSRYGWVCPSFRGEILKPAHKISLISLTVKVSQSPGYFRSYIVRNSLLVVVTLIGFDLAGLIGGAIITEGYSMSQGWQCVLPGDNSRRGSNDCFVFCSFCNCLYACESLG